MVGSFPVSVAIGILLGFLTGLGTGGGSLLILWLTLVLGMEPGTARAINLLFFFPAAITASLLRWRKGKIPWKKIWLPTLCGCVSAAVFSMVGNLMNVAVLEKFFGVLLVFTGSRELFLSTGRQRLRKPR